MPAYIRTKNIFDAKVNILINNIFSRKLMKAMMCVIASLCLGYQNIPDTCSSSRNVMMTNCPLSSPLTTSHCVTRQASPQSNIQLKLSAKRTLRTPRRLKIVPIVIVILKHLIMALMKVFRVRE